MNCPLCHAEEDENGERAHTAECAFGSGGQARLEAMLEAVAPKPAEPQPKAEPEPMRLMQFVGNVELTPEGEPKRITVLIQGGLVSVFELNPESPDEITLGDAVDIALARAGRRVLSVDVR